MDTLSVALTGISEFKMIDRGRMTSTIKEQAFQQSGLADLSQSVKLGKILGAEILVTGTIQNFDKKFRITASFIDIQTGKIVQASKVTGENIFDLQDQLADQIILLENIKLSNQQRQEITRITKSTINNQAFDNYTNGMTLLYKITNSGLIKDMTKASESEIQEMLDKGFEYFNKALEADNNYFLAYAAKAEIQAMYYLFNSLKENADITKLNEYLEQADQNVQLAYKISRNSGSVYRSLAFVNYISGKDLNKSIEYSLMALNYNPNDKEAKTWLGLEYFSRGIRFFKQNEYDKAVNDFEKSVEIMPSFNNAYYELGKAYQATNEINKAIINYEKSLSLVPDNTKVTEPFLKIYQEKADQYYKASDFENLEKTYNLMIKYQPKSADLYNNLAIAYFMQKKFDLSEETYKKAIELNAVNGSFYDNLGLLYETKGEKDKADLSYKKACELGNKPSCK